MSDANRGQPSASHQPVFLGSIIDRVSRPLEKMISVASDKGSGVWQEVWKRWKDDDGGVRSCQLKLALHVRPAQSIATNLVSQQNYLSILCFTFLQSYIVTNGQGSRHQIWFLGMLSKAGAFCMSDQGQPVDRCHQRCRRKTFKTGRRQYVIRAPPWKTLFNQTTGSNPLPASNHHQYNQGLADWAHPSWQISNSSQNIGRPPHPASKPDCHNYMNTFALFRHASVSSTYPCQSVCPSVGR